MEQIVLKTVGELRTYLDNNNISDKVRIKIFIWDCYNDEPFHRNVIPVQMKTKTGRIKELSL